MGGYTSGQQISSAQANAAQNGGGQFVGLGFSVGGTFAIGTLGINIQFGVVHDDGILPTAFLSLNHAVGLDISVEAGAFVVINNNPNKEFKGSDFSGYGGSYNFGLGPISYSVGGDGGPKGEFPNNFTVHTLGVSASPTPVSLSVYHGNTWTWPSLPMPTTVGAKILK